MAQLLVQPTWVEKIKESQQKDPQLLKITEEVKENAKLDFRVDEEGILSSGERVCVPNNEELKMKILEEAHGMAYTMHPGSTKMYQDLKEIFCRGA